MYNNSSSSWVGAPGFLFLHYMLPISHQYASHTTQHRDYVDYPIYVRMRRPYKPSRLSQDVQARRYIASVSSKSTPRQATRAGTDALQYCRITTLQQLDHVGASVITRGGGSLEKTLSAQAENDQLPRGLLVDGWHVHTYICMLRFSRK